MVALFAIAFACTLAAPGAAAESPEETDAILWVLDDPDDEHAEAILEGIEQAVAGDEQRHLIGTQQLQRRIEDGSQLRSGCAMGVESCGPAERMAFEALGLGVMIRLAVDHRGDVFEINYEMVDRRGDIARSGQLEGDDARQAGFAVVSELFDAVGLVFFESTPEGAAVVVDDEQVGETPLSEQFAVGDYDYRIEHQGHDPHTGTLQVDADQPRHIEAQLNQHPGHVRVSGAVEDAGVWLDDQQIGSRNEEIELPAGQHLLEVRADDYDTVRRTVQIEPGLLTEVEIEEMTPRSAFLRDIEPAEIANHRLQLEAGLEIGGQMAGLPAARTVSDPPDQLFGGWLDGDEQTDRHFITPAGLRLGVNWEGDWFGLGLLSVSVLRRNLDQRFQLVDRTDGEITEVSMTSLSALQIRPMQLRARFFYENLAPFAQTGLGVNFLSARGETDGGDPLRLRQVEPLAALEMGVRYHFDPTWSLGASYRLQASLAGGTGAAHTIGISFGGGLRDLPLIDPRPPEQL